MDYMGSSVYSTENKYRSNFMNPDSKPVEIIRFPEDIDNGAPTFLFKEIEAILERQNAKKLPVFIISITGVFRSGKSFLLNLMKTYLEYFAQYNSDDEWERCKGMQIKGGAWAQSKKAVTRGIWMWDHPFIINGVAILLMDCQGTGDTGNSSPTMDNLILYIGLQMAQVQILNLKGNLLSTDLERLQLCAEYADIEDDGPTPEAIFDSLIFLVRDWQHGEVLGELDNEFKDILREAKAGAVKRSGEGIQKAFEIIKTFAFPHPGPKVSSSSEHHNLTIGDVNEGFILASKDLFQKLFLFLPLHKALENGKGTMRKFRALKKRTVDSELSKIRIKTGAEALMESLLNKAFVEASQFYDDEMIKAYKVDFADEQAVEDHLEKIVRLTIEKFKNKRSIAKYGDSRTKEEYLKCLRQKGDWAVLDEKKKFIVNAQKLYQQNLEYERKLKIRKEEEERLEEQIKKIADEAEAREKEERRMRNEEQRKLKTAKEDVFRRQVQTKLQEKELQWKQEREKRAMQVQQEINMGYQKQDELEAELQQDERQMEERKEVLDKGAELLRDANEKEVMNKIENWVDEIDKAAKKKYKDKSKCVIS